MNDRNYPAQGPDFLSGGAGGKVAIVTGGGSGLGLAIAEKFTQNGIRTIIVGRDEEKLKTAKAQLGANCFAYGL
jgi:NADP-dependent 3-hydroxy acid dehydrogenase YdfG